MSNPFNRRAVSGIRLSDFLYSYATSISLVTGKMPILLSFVFTNLAIVFLVLDFEFGIYFGF
jgi:hypothetical protein